MHTTSSTSKLSEEHLLKVDLYLEYILQCNIDEARNKALELSKLYIVSCKDIAPEFLEKVYHRLKLNILASKSYWLFRLFDNLLRKLKPFSTWAQADLKKLFLEVFREQRIRGETAILAEMKLVWKVWTFIFDAKHLKNLKDAVSQQFQVDLEGDISAKDLARLKEFVKQIEPKEEKNSLQQELLLSDSN